MTKSRTAAQSRKIARLFHALGQPARLRILLAIGRGEACVCHLEAALGQRQAYISQQLMELRRAGIVTPHRDGRNIFYQIKDPSLLNLIRSAAQFLGLSEEDIPIAEANTLLPNCCCPHCLMGEEPSFITIDPVMEHDHA